VLLPMLCVSVTPADIRPLKGTFCLHQQDMRCLNRLAPGLLKPPVNRSGGAALSFTMRRHTVLLICAASAIGLLGGCADSSGEGASATP
jgi:hypothetical protein